MSFKKKKLIPHEKYIKYIIIIFLKKEKIISKFHFASQSYVALVANKK